MNGIYSIEYINFENVPHFPFKICRSEGSPASVTSTENMRPRIFAY